MSTTYRKWLLAQLDLLNHPEPDLEDFDTFRHVLREAECRSAKLGQLEAVRACQVRPGPISAAIAREALTACLAALPPVDRKRKKQPENSTLLTVDEAAEKFNLSARTIYRLTQSEELPCTRIGTGRGTIRIRPADLERYLRQRQGKETLFG